MEDNPNINSNNKIKEVPILEESRRLFKINYSDGTTYVGGTIETPNWRICPDKNVTSLSLLLPYGDSICLFNYERYNFFIGAIKAFNEKSLKIAHMFGLGCTGDIVTSYRITLSTGKSDRYKVGDITVRQFPLGKEGVGRVPTYGWKNGILE